MIKDVNAGGVGGLLRNSDREWLVEFSFRLGAAPPMLAEISAIKLQGGVRKGGYVPDSFPALAIVKQTH
ncbi:hypothetical protein V6N13_125271 [Hibiscus sabdariffa]